MSSHDGLSCQISCLGIAWIGLTVLCGNQVAMRHINLGVEQMFSAAHMQLLTSCCPLEKLVLASLVLETKAQGDQAACNSAVALIPLSGKLHSLSCTGAVG